MKRLTDLVAAEPALLTAALRAWLLVAAGFGLDLSPEAIAGLMVAVEYTLAMVTRALSTPTRDVDQQIAQATAVHDDAVARFLVETERRRAAVRPLRGRNMGP